MTLKRIFIFIFLCATISVAAQSLDHSRWNDMLQSYVNIDGKVNYKSIKADEKNLEIYLNTLSENTPQDSWTKAEKLAYWINAYNAFTIKLIIDNYPIKSIKDIKQPWDKKFIDIDGKLISLNQIEHDILRKMNEPRIHFAIVCASVSCPKLQNTAFEPSKIEEQLTNATKEFLADSSKNNISQESIKISKIFDWFSKDFTQDGSLINFLNQYSEVTISPSAKKQFKNYNWALNE
tara:strand:+ start:6231 stop:6935 length:705 start_codon:yes stop_codon:yes gene_type:complete